MPDKRVQCCLYFIAPSGHGLKPLDTEFMKRLHEKVNLLPKQTHSHQRNANSLKNSLNILKTNLTFSNAPRILPSSDPFAINFNDSITTHHSKSSISCQDYSTPRRQNSDLSVSICRSQASVWASVCILSFIHFLNAVTATIYQVVTNHL
ncbi:septin-14-like isoform X2 [Gorilla gorilla gorilla]